MYWVWQNTMVQKWNFPFQENAVGSIIASQCIYRIKEDHTSVGHRVHVKPVLDVS